VSVVARSPLVVPTEGEGAALVVARLPLRAGVS